MHLHDIHLGTLHNDLQSCHTNTANIVPFSNRNFPVSMGPHCCCTRISDIFRLVYPDCHSNCPHIYRTVHPNNLPYNSKSCHWFVDPMHTVRHECVPMQWYPGNDTVDNRFHFPAMDYHNNLQCTGHNCIHWCSPGMTHTDRFGHHNFAYVHCTHTADNSGNSRNPIDTDRTPFRMCSDGSYIDRLSDRNHCPWLQYCYNHKIYIPPVRSRMFPVRTCHTVCQRRSVYIDNCLRTRGTFCSWIRLHDNYKLCEKWFYWNDSRVCKSDDYLQLRWTTKYWHCEAALYIDLADSFRNWLRSKFDCIRAEYILWAVVLQECLRWIPVSLQCVEWVQSIQIELNSVDQSFRHCSPFLPNQSKFVRLHHPPDFGDEQNEF